MKKAELINQIVTKKSLLTIGLDTDLNKLPIGIEKSWKGVVEFNKRIIETTEPYAVAYKINTAFYEWGGVAGWDALEKTLQLLPSNVLKIADAKRGDIGNTSDMYAKTFFETFDFDAVTVAPYMGYDSIKPFTDYTDKWTIVLGLTSNAGAYDYQKLKTEDGKYLFETVIEKAAKLGTENNMMFVVGATQSDYLQIVREIIPNHFLLVPGIGSQGGDLQALLATGLNQDYGLLINSSRQILYASIDENFAETAMDEAKKVQEQMAKLLI
ncbi:MAG: orotidine-5'-phosphate decarboxylase [Bacteroidota bacterium]|nr:orotidine-5'-phosphate decarboxylase [Bacteroidota bacterium]